MSEALSAAYFTWRAAVPVNEEKPEIAMANKMMRIATNKNWTTVLARTWRLVNFAAHGPQKSPYMTSFIGVRGADILSKAN
jgi:hypothetical protein